MLMMLPPHCCCVAECHQRVHHHAAPPQRIFATWRPCDPRTAWLPMRRRLVTHHLLHGSWLLGHSHWDSCCLGPDQMPARHAPAPVRLQPTSFLLWPHWCCRLAQSGSAQTLATATRHWHQGRPSAGGQGKIATQAKPQWQRSKRASGSSKALCQRWQPQLWRRLCRRQALVVMPSHHRRRQLRRRAMAVLLAPAGRHGLVEWLRCWSACFVLHWQCQTARGHLLTLVTQMRQSPYHQYCDRVAICALLLVVFAVVVAEVVIVAVVADVGAVVGVVCCGGGVPQPAVSAGLLAGDWAVIAWCVGTGAAAASVRVPLSWLLVCFL